MCVVQSHFSFSLQSLLLSTSHVILYKNKKNNIPNTCLFLINISCCYVSYSGRDCYVTIFTISLIQMFHYCFFKLFSTLALKVSITPLRSSEPKIALAATTTLAPAAVAKSTVLGDKPPST
mmetsp:Transcript_14987/g.17100  ORF Transcript_14987/g.17100 Transcript_14987/m.17100 type:complete len:121 (+) Transcript_14987:43-405(+)